MLSSPELLIAFRAVCAPAIFVLACFHFPGALLAAIVLTAFLSDIFDGVLARRQGGATPGVRYADTLVDTLFYVAAAIALRVAVPATFEGMGLAVFTLIIVHVSRTTFELTKYGRIASYHMWSSKVLGVLIAATMTWCFLTGETTILVAVALWFAIANELEGFWVSVMLPRWCVDIPSVVHAWRGRRDAYQFPTPARPNSQATPKP